MFNLLSSIITSPTAIILSFVILGFIFRKWKSLKRMMWGMAAVLFLLFSNPPLYEVAYRQWFAEYDHPLPVGKTYRYGIVLGGYSHWDWERDRVEFSNIADRLLEGIRLYKLGRIEQLVLASDGSIIECENAVDMKGNPEEMMAFLKAMGMPEEDIIMETKAWNTQENATFTLELIGDSLKMVPSLLITSASHMRRSLETFHRAGIPSDPYITDTPVQVGDQQTSWMPSLAVLLRWQELLHEWVGYVYYAWKGNIE